MYIVTCDHTRPQDRWDMTSFGAPKRERLVDREMPRMGELLCWCMTNKRSAMALKSVEAWFNQPYFFGLNKFSKQNGKGGPP